MEGYISWLIDYYRWRLPWFDYGLFDNLMVNWKKLKIKVSYINFLSIFCQEVMIYFGIFATTTFPLKFSIVDVLVKNALNMFKQIFLYYSMCGICIFIITTFSVHVLAIYLFRYHHYFKFCRCWAVFLFLNYLYTK